MKRNISIGASLLAALIALSVGQSALEQRAEAQAKLTVRANFADPPITLPPAAWDYTDASSTAIKLNPPRTNFGDPRVFGPSGLYEFSY